MMKDESVNKIEDCLRTIEKLVEEQGRNICNDSSKVEDWHFCNKYLEQVAELIHSTYRFYYM